jgi:alpha-tubulin suppressor-like RCC1 family protein
VTTRRELGLLLVLGTGLLACREDEAASKRDPAPASTPSASEAPEPAAPEQPRPAFLKPAAITDAIAVAAGDAHSCALRSGGAVWCWGSNDDKQQGYRPIDDAIAVEGRRIFPPAAQAKLAGAVALAVGPDDTCAVLETGRVTCVGRNSLDVHDQLRDAVEVALGMDFACARLRDGSLRCWGGGVTGELGNGTLRSSAKPVRVKGIRDAVDIAAGDLQACAVLGDGRVECWGDNRSLVLIGGPGGAVKTPSEIPGVREAVQVAIRSSHGCARTSAGALWCWGEIGGDPTARERAVEVSDFPPAQDLVVSGTRTCVLAPAGEVWCHDAQLGSEPERISGLDQVRSLSAGSFHVCALRHSGHVACFGSDNERGALDGTGQRLFR